jgi:hypothetical protein
LYFCNHDSVAHLLPAHHEEVHDDPRGEARVQRLRKGVAVEVGAATAGAGSTADTAEPGVFLSPPVTRNIVVVVFFVLSVSPLLLSGGGALGRLLCVHRIHVLALDTRSCTAVCVAHARALEKIVV